MHGILNILPKNKLINCISGENPNSELRTMFLRREREVICISGNRFLLHLNFQLLLKLISRCQTSCVYMYADEIDLVVS